MDFIIGGSHQGKRKYIQEHYVYKSVFEGADSSIEELGCAEAVFDVHILIRRLLKEGMSPDAVTEQIAKICAKVISADEIGYGLVPVDKFERMYREAVGRQCCQIAARADTVVRIVCGIPNVIKRTGIKLTFIRHGLTKGNEEKRYVGVTDEPLSERGIEELQKIVGKYHGIQPDCILVSPMKRCLETARILFPKCRYRVVEDFRECDFGQFEYKNCQELDGKEAYQQFIDSGGKTGFPEGELPEKFRTRCQEAFRREMKQIETCQDVKQVVFVVHGGTIMSILDGFSEPHGEYFTWQAANGEGFRGELFLQEGAIRKIQKITL